MIFSVCLCFPLCRHIKATGSSQQPGQEETTYSCTADEEVQELIYSAENNEEDIYGSLVNFSKTSQETSHGSGGFAGKWELCGEVQVDAKHVVILTTSMCMFSVSTACYKARTHTAPDYNHNPL